MDFGGGKGAFFQGRVFGVRKGGFLGGKFFGGRGIFLVERDGSFAGGKCFRGDKGVWWGEGLLGKGDVGFLRRKECFFSERGVFVPQARGWGCSHEPHMMGPSPPHPSARVPV